MQTAASWALMLLYFSKLTRKVITMFSTMFIKTTNAVRRTCGR